MLPRASGSLEAFPGQQRKSTPKTPLRCSPLTSVWWDLPVYNGMQSLKSPNTKQTKNPTIF
ncbi:hypothetical protein I79_018877 [Cricetulus griseus]|uniref:Uncharacterized protein n=1 Tax=Cricetulus griseus TaxID=10029 RepID=G3I5W6_CRIGR|nr:hypothetical protein I79_018877 [Cricetulus griseus]